MERLLKRSIIHSLVALGRYNPQGMTDPNPSEFNPSGSDSTRGRLKVFLGYAPGVGKSFRRFAEGRRPKERGQDVVVGALQPQVHPEIEPILRLLEVIPTTEIQ